MVKTKNKLTLKIVTASLLIVFATIVQGAILQPVFADAKSCTAAGKVPIAIKINGQDCLDKNQITITWAKAIIQFLATGIGIAVTGGIVWGGILYMTARDNASQTQKAIYIISNAIVGLVLFMLMFAAINFLIPGGILG